MKYAGVSQRLSLTCSSPCQFRFLVFLQGLLDMEDSEAEEFDDEDDAWLEEEEVRRVNNIGLGHVSNMRHL
jgi:hypothetical protein